MRQEVSNLAREDRPANLHELGQVIALLIATDQLPLTTLASFESEDNQSEESGIEFGMGINRDRLQAADIEHLTNVILGRSPRFN
jgi:hypothetical protein